MTDEKANFPALLNAHNFLGQVLSIDMGIKLQDYANHSSEQIRQMPEIEQEKPLLGRKSNDVKETLFAYKVLQEAWPLFVEANTNEELIKAMNNSHHNGLAPNTYVYALETALYWDKIKENENFPRTFLPHEHRFLTPSQKEEITTALTEFGKAADLTRTVAAEVQSLDAEAKALKFHGIPAPEKR